MSPKGYLIIQNHLINSLIITGKILRRNAENVTKVLDNIENFIDQHSYRPMDQAESIFRQSTQYR